jgi:hypothetical protein
MKKQVKKTEKVTKKMLKKAEKNIIENDENLNLDIFSQNLNDYVKMFQSRNTK